MNMGQTVDLSFRDIKMINLAYCTAGSSMVNQSRPVHINWIKKNNKEKNVYVAMLSGNVWTNIADV